MLRVLIIGLIVASTVFADEPNKFVLAAPAGWGGETIKLAPGFARDMKWKGVEHIRFAPGMMKADSKTFFSYAFVFELDRDTNLTQESVAQELLKYYRGLSSAVGRGKIQNLDTSKFSFQLKPTKSATFPEESANCYTGVLDWIEPFATQKPQKLNVEIQTWSNSKHHYVFASVSPQEIGSAIWKQLYKIRDDYVAGSK